MKETSEISQKGISPSQELVDTIIIWWDYLLQKEKTHPEAALGLATKLITDDSTPTPLDRTTRLSLVDISAPELADLGQLVGAKKRPQVDVEGIKNFNSRVPFDEILDHIMDFASRGEISHIHDLFQRLKINPRHFLLHIYAANDLEVYGNLFSLMRVKNIMIVTEPNGMLRSATHYEQEWAINLPTNSHSIQPHLFHTRRKTYLTKPDENRAIQIALDNAYKKLRQF